MPESVSPLDSGDELPQVINLSQIRVESVAAELVRMHQSAAAEITAGEVELQQSAAYKLNAGKVESSESALGLVNATEVSLSNSAAVAIRSDSVTASGIVGLAAAENVNLRDAYSGVVVGRDVRGDRIETLVLLANRIEGDVHAVVDARSALIAGLVGGLFGGLILLLGWAVFKRD
jgi:hypothetical protein